MPWQLDGGLSGDVYQYCHAYLEVLELAFGEVDS